MADSSVAALVGQRPREIAISPVRIVSTSLNGRTRALERLHLLDRASDLDDDRALVDIYDLAAEDLGDLHHVATVTPVDGDL